MLHVAADVGPRDGPIVVLVHGIASSAATFAPVAEELPGHRLIFLDLLGFGRSHATRDTRFSTEDHAAALEATIEKLKLSSFTLVGHSLGALTAARYAASNEHRLTAVVLVSPPIYVPASVLPEGAARAAMGLYLRSYDYLRANKRFTIRLSRLVSRLLPVREVLEVNDQNWTAFEASMKNAVESQTAVADIASAKVPVEVVYGTLDPFVVPELISLLGALRQVQVHRVVGSTHIIGRALAREVACVIKHHASTERHSPSSPSVSPLS
jgi:pimeloyl-ACP methyl ester carboxylesterase